MLPRHQLYRAGNKIGWLVAHVVADTTHGPFAGRELFVLQTLPEGPDALHVVLADDARPISVDEGILVFSEQLRELLDQAMFHGAGLLALWLACQNEIDGVMHGSLPLTPRPLSSPRTSLG